MVLTDYCGNPGYMDSAQAIRNGGDAMLVNYDMGSNHLTDQTSATSILAMRQACKNIMYTVVNSRAYSDENLNPPTPVWQTILIAIDVVVVLAILALELTIIRQGYKKRKTA